MTTPFDSYCGLQCAECGFRESHGCGGCLASNGQPFHGRCEIAECAREKGKRFCGECEELPCEIITRYAHDAEHGDGGARIERCRAIKTELVRTAREGLQPISYCGHHCDFCVFGPWCGGCRSDYNCCSFATLHDGNICPNVRCAKEKGLTGCYECADLAACAKGYYGREREYTAKATALFMQKHGAERYTETLRRAIADGLDYPQAFDDAGNVAQALALLERYL